MQTEKLKKKKENNYICELNMNIVRNECKKRWQIALIVNFFQWLCEFKKIPPRYKENSVHVLPQPSPTGFRDICGAVLSIVTLHSIAVIHPAKHLWSFYFHIA